MPSTAALSPKRLVRPWTETIVWADIWWGRGAGIRRQYGGRRAHRLGYVAWLPKYRPLPPCPAGPDTPREVGRVSLRTLVFVRWIVIIGQLVTVSVVALGFRFPMQLTALIAIIALATVVNLLGMIMRRGRALSDRAVAFYLAFDILQLSALLFLTGGLTNPFAVLVLGPIAVAAAVLGRDYSFALTFLAIICLAALFASPFDLPWNGGGSPRLARPLSARHLDRADLGLRLHRHL